MELKNEIKIVLLQQEIAWENLPANLEYFETIISNLSTHIDIVVLPEMFTTGFSMNPEKYEEESLVSSINTIKTWSATYEKVICGSIMFKENGNYLNRFCWFEPNKKEVFYDKAHLFRMGDENLHYTKGNKQVIINFKGWKIAPFICYDLRFPVWMRRNVNYDYDLIILVANWPERRAKHWNALTLARAIENQSYLVAVNRVGYDGNGVFHSGDSVALNPLGVVLLDAKSDIGTFEINLNYPELLKIRENFPVGLDADTFQIN